jgi:hypothetical protein
MQRNRNREESRHGEVTETEEEKSRVVTSQRIIGEEETVDGSVEMRPSDAAQGAGGR